MASPLDLSRLQSPSHIIRASPWKTETKPALVHTTTHLSLPLSKRATTSLYAERLRVHILSAVSDDKQKQGGINSNEGGGDEEDAIPEVVFNRMLVRIVSFVAVPLNSGVGLLYALSSLKELGK